MDERYERSADMRLLEFEREARGLPLRVTGSTKYSDPDQLADLGRDDDETYAQNGTILVASIDAQPRAALIPGALVTVSLSISNEGDTAAAGVRMSLPLPVDTVYRTGSLSIDGATGTDALAYELFGNGAELGIIDPGARRTMALKLVIEAGVADIRLSPQLSATSGAILGLRAMRLTRKEALLRGAPVERPFYESDDAEISAEAEPPAARGSSISVVQPSEFPAALHAESKTDVPALDVQVVPDASVPRAPESVPPQAPRGAPPEPAATPVARPLPSIPKSAQPTKGRPGPSTPLPSKSQQTTGVPAKTPPLPAETNSTEAVAASSPRIPAVVPSAPAASVRTAPAKAKTKHVSDTKDNPKRGAAPKTKVSSKPTAGKVSTSRADDIARPRPKAGKDATARPKLEVVRSVDDRLAIAAKGGPILTVRLDRKRLTTLSGLFSGQSFGMIAHYLVLNALATKDALPGDSTDGSIAAFVAEQEQLLSRALIGARLGKTPSPESVSATLPGFRSALTAFTPERTVEMPPAGEILLFRAFQPSETTFLERTLSNDNAFPFMRAAYLFVGLCANDAVVANDSDRKQLAIALSAYAALATAEISRIFLRAKLSREPAIFKDTDPAFDNAARTVLAALGRSVV